MMWLKQLFSRRRLYNDLSEEINEHLEEKIEELVATGMSRKEAAAAARREFGNVTLTEEDSRTVWRWPSIENFLTDLRYAARMLRKSPGFTAVNPAGGFLPDASPVSAPNFLAWRQANHVFADVAAADVYRTVNLSSQAQSAAEGQPEPLRDAAVSPNYFSVLGVSPQLGRTF